MTLQDQKRAKCPTRLNQRLQLTVIPHLLDTNQNKHIYKASKESRYLKAYDFELR